jgi:hypothetical protein
MAKCPLPLFLMAIIRTLDRRDVITWFTPCLNNGWFKHQIDIVATAAIKDNTGVAIVVIEFPSPHASFTLMKCPPGNLVSSVLPKKSMVNAGEYDGP